MHVYSEPPKRAIYTMLYDTELVWVILTQTNRVPIKSLFGLTKNQVVSSQKQISKLEPVLKPGSCVQSANMVNS